MTMALKWGSDDPSNQGLIYFNAVTAYSESHSGQVTKHPVDSGGNITDHFIKDNSKYTLSVVITGVDIGNNSYLIRDVEGNTAYNTTPAPTSVSINSTDNSILNKLLPGSISQFLSSSSPEVVMDSARNDLLDQIKFFLTDLVSGEKYNSATNQYDSYIQVVELYQFEGSLLTDIVFDLVLTSISFDERPDTGKGLFCNLTLEQVRFVTLQKTAIPKSVASSLSNKAASKSVQSKNDSTVKDTDNPIAGEAVPSSKATDIDPMRNETSG